MIVCVCRLVLQLQLTKNDSPSLGAEVPEAYSFLGWQVNYNEAIDTSLLAILK